MTIVGWTFPPAGSAGRERQLRGKDAAHGLKKLGLTVRTAS